MITCPPRAQAPTGMSPLLDPADVAHRVHGRSGPAKGRLRHGRQDQRPRRRTLERHAAGAPEHRRPRRRTRPRRGQATEAGHDKVAGGRGFTTGGGTSTRTQSRKKFPRPSKKIREGLDKTFTLCDNVYIMLILTKRPIYPGKRCEGCGGSGHHTTAAALRCATAHNRRLGRRGLSTESESLVIIHLGTGEPTPTIWDGRRFLPL